MYGNYPFTISEQITKFKKKMCNFYSIRFHFTCVRFAASLSSTAGRMPCTKCGTAILNHINAICASTAQSSVAVHMRRVHTGVKPHKCKQCDKAFVVKGHLRIHMAQKHCGGLPFNCDCCSVGFWKKQEYGNHMALVHNDGSVLQCVRKGKQYKVTVRPDDLQ